MTGAIVEIPHIKSEIQRKFRLDKGVRESLADFLRRRYPVGTAKSTAREFNISIDRAREAVAGRASLTSIEAIFRRGGPSVFLPILEEVWGGSLARHFADLRKTHDDNGERLAALFGDLRPVGADRRAGDPDVSGLGDYRRRAGDHRPPQSDRKKA